MYYLATTCTLNNKEDRACTHECTQIPVCNLYRPPPTTSAFPFHDSPHSFKPPTPSLAVVATSLSMNTLTLSYPSYPPLQWQPRHSCLTTWLLVCLPRAGTAAWGQARVS